MPLACPQCHQTFEQNGVCPLCNVILLYHAPVIPAESTSRPMDDEPPQWQQTPWGKILIGMILAQGVSLGLQQLLTAGFLASGDGSDVWQTLWGIVLHHAVFAVGLLMGGALTGAGQSKGIIYGAVVGVASGIISLFIKGYRSEEFASWLVYAEPLIHLATGALGGALGMLIWRPAPRIPELENSTLTPIPLPQWGATLDHLFTGPVHVTRVCVGAFVIVVGVVWANAILEFLLRASNGTLSISSKLQAQLVSMEISAIVALLGAGFAGATTRNGFKQGMCVGFSAAVIVLGIQIGNPRFSLESAIFTIAGVVIIAVVGGWFGGQLFPPYDPHKRRRRRLA